MACIRPPSAAVSNLILASARPRPYAHTQRHIGTVLISNEKRSSYRFYLVLAIHAALRNLLVVRCTACCRSADKSHSADCSSEIVGRIRETRMILRAQDITCAEVQMLPSASGVSWTSSQNKRPVHCLLETRQWRLWYETRTRGRSLLPDTACPALSRIPAEATHFPSLLLCADPSTARHARARDEPRRSYGQRRCDTFGAVDSFYFFFLFGGLHSYPSAPDCQ